MFEDRLSFPPHVGEHSLAKMPSEDLGRRSPGVFKELTVEVGTRDVERIPLEKNYLVVVLCSGLGIAKVQGYSKLTSGSIENK